VLADENSLFCIRKQAGKRVAQNVKGTGFAGVQIGWRAKSVEKASGLGMILP
jgi:hypothetical protein